MNIKQRGRSARAIGVVCAIMVLVSGVTYAALQSQNATSAGNKISSATANLVIGDANGAYGATATGYNFANVQPGGGRFPAAGNFVKLRNAGTSNLALQLTVNRSTLMNINGANLDDVFIDITASGQPPKEYSLNQLMDAYQANTPLSLDTTLAAGQDGQYNVQVVVSPDAVPNSQSNVVLNNVDLVFSGKMVV